MADPALLKQAAYIVTRGAITLVTEEVSGQFRRRQKPVTTPIEGITEVDGDGLGETALTLGALHDYPELPSLDESPLGEALTPEITPPEVPEDLFAVIVGMELEKRVLRRAIATEKPVHVLLIGAPGSAKSLFLEELRRLPESRYVVGGNMTPVGLLDIVSAGGVRYLLVDEIDKTSKETQATLLSVMTGKATRATHDKQLEIDTDIRVYAAGNSADPLLAPLRSRFVELHLPAYTEAQRREVIRGFLVARQGMDAADAGKIADLMAPLSADVRDAEQIAEISKADPQLAKELAARLAHAPAPAPHRATRST